MIDALVEVVKLVGAIGGLASSEFLVYDRLIKSRPMVYFGSDKGDVVLCVKNTIDEAIVVNSIEHPDSLEIERSKKKLPHPNPPLSPKAVGVFAVIGPQEERLCPVIFTASLRGLVGDEVKIRVHWSNTRRAFGKRRRLIKIRTNTWDLQSMAMDAERREKLAAIQSAQDSGQ